MPLFLPSNLRHTLVWVILAGLSGWYYFAVYKGGKETDPFHAPERPTVAWDRPNPVPPPDVPDHRDGTAIRFLANKVEDMDGLLLRSGGDTLIAHFPPHMASQVRALASVGTGLRCRLSRLPHREKMEGYPVYRLDALTNENGETLEVASRPPSPHNRVGQLVTDTLNTFQLKTDELGRLVGIVGDGYLFELNARQTDQLPAGWYRHSPVIIQGMARPANTGFVNLGGYQLVHPSTLAIDGKTYLLR